MISASYSLILSDIASIADYKDSISLSYEEEISCSLSELDPAKNDTTESKKPSDSDSENDSYSDTCSVKLVS